MNTDDKVVKCAKRIVEKLSKSKYYKLNGEYPKAIQTEIKRMENYFRVTPVPEWRDK